MRRWWIGAGVAAAGIAALAALPAVLPARTALAVGLPLRINAGGGAVTDSQGNQWAADRPYSTSAGYGYIDNDSTGGSADPGIPVSGTQNDAIYSTERWGMSGYRIDVPNGTYDVKLLFAETYSGITGPGQRVFDVSVQGHTVLSRLDVYREVGFATALTKDVQGVQVTDGQLDIGFTPHVEQPMIKGIEVQAESSVSPASTTSATATPTPAATPTATVTATPAGTAQATATPTPTPPPPTPTAIATSAPPTAAATPTPTASSTSQQPAVAQVPIRVDAGGPAFVDRQGNQWLADQAYSAGSGWGYIGGHEASFATQYQGGVGLEPHSSGREGMSAYRFNVPDLPQGSFYAVTLYFTGRLNGVNALGQRIFYATVGQTVPGEQEAAVVGPIDPWTAFHSYFVPDTYQVQYIRPVNGVLEITFTPIVGQAVINGITIERQQ